MIGNPRKIQSSNVDFNMQLDLKGKKILLMTFKFYDYADRIVRELEAQGAQVQLIYNRWESESFKYSTNRILTLYMRLKNPLFKRKFTNQTIKEVENSQFDILLAIGGFSAGKRLIDKLKIQNPKIITRIFFWDSFNYWKIQNVRKWFDMSYSFDPVDCGKYSDMKYLPDFYIGQQTKGSVKKYDVSHIGSSHIFVFSRIPILTKLKQNLDSQNLSSFLMVYEPVNPGKIKSWLLALTSNRWRKYMSTVRKFKTGGILTDKLMDYQKVVEIESQSRCIVDIPPPKQSGITIRALEAVASGKKLVTTNAYIKQQPFYNSRNIVIIDPENPVIDPEFICSETVATDITHLRLDNWLKTILS